MPITRLLAALGLLALSGVLQAESTFNEVAQTRGLTHSGTTYGASWVPDINGDGRPDLWLGNHSSAADPILYTSTAQGGFVESSATSGVTTADMHGAAWGDFNHDGLSDLLVMVGGGGGSGSGPNQLLVHNGTQLVESAAAYNIDYPFGRGRQSTWFDWNQDGFLDLIVINKNDRSVPPNAFSRVFTYDPNNSEFVEENWTIHTQDNQQFANLLFSNPSLGSGANAFITHVRKGNRGPDSSYSYDGNGISNIDSAYGFPNLAYVNDAMPGDFNNDGDQDMVFAQAGLLQLFEQRSNGFVNVTAGSGLSASNGHYVTVADFNNDMYLDIYVARANPGQDVNQPNYLFENQGDGTFNQVPTSAGADGTLAGYVSSATSVDYNNDGWMDLFLTNSDDWWAPRSATTGTPMQLLENTTSNGNHWLKILLEGTTSNTDGIGAVVEVRAGGVSQWREQNGGVHHRSQDDSRLHFGLAGHTQADLIIVNWPSGIVQQLSAIPADQTITITESAGGGGNNAPVAQFSSTPAAQALTVDFDGSASSDVDGSVTAWAWDFGDGNSSSGQTTSHSYASSGTYTVTLTVTDDDMATGVLSQQVVVNDASANQRQLTSVVAVGAKSNISDRLNDAQMNGDQDLATFWRNNNQQSTAWVTLDIGSAQTVVELRIAPRENRQHDLAIEVGDTLLSDQVSGGVVNSCNKPNLGSSVAPSDLFVCTLAVSANGRYITVRSTNRTSLRIYGIEVWTNAEGGGGNSPPTAAFSHSTSLLQADLDASASSDADGSIVSWDWNFGDGNSASGEVLSHTYASAGTYTVQLTVSDDQGAMDSATAAVTVSDGGGGGGQVAATLVDVGSSAGQQDRILDTDAGAQNLNTFWRSNGNAGTGWFTVDIGAGTQLTEIHIAPKANLRAELDFYVGDSLTAGRVTGSPADSCSIPPVSGTSTPTSLFVCTVVVPAGTYLTVEATVPDVIRIYGAEFYE